MKLFCFVYNENKMFQFQNVKKNISSCFLKKNITNYVLKNLQIRQTITKTMTAYRASIIYDVHRGTISNHLNGHSKSTKRGRP